MVKAAECRFVHAAARCLDDMTSTAVHMQATSSALPFETTLAAPEILPGPGMKRIWWSQRSWHGLLACRCKRGIRNWHQKVNIDTATSFFACLKSLKAVTYCFHPSLIVRALSSLSVSADCTLAVEVCLLRGGRFQLAVGESGSSPVA